MISSPSREEYFKKKRYGGEFATGGKPGEASGPTSHNLAQDPQLRELVDQWLKRNYDISELFSLVEATASGDRMKQHYGVIGLRKILSNGNKLLIFPDKSNLSLEQGPPIQSVIDANMVPRLIIFMQDEKEPHLQVPRLCIYHISSLIVGSCLGSYQYCLWNHPTNPKYH